MGNRAAEQGVRERVCGSGSDGGKRGAKRIRATGDGWLAVEGKRGRAGVGGTGRIGDRGEKALAQ